MKGPFRELAVGSSVIRPLTTGRYFPVFSNQLPDVPNEFRSGLKTTLHSPGCTAADDTELELVETLRDRHQRNTNCMIGLSCCTYRGL
jgi:hypothetical protein